MNKIYLGIIGASALFFCMGAAGGYYVEKSHSQEMNSESSIEKETRKAQEPILHHLGKMNVPIFKGSEITYILADINLSIKYDNQDMITENSDNALKAITLETLVDYASTGRLDEGVIDQDRIASDIKKNINDTIGLEFVEAVLFVDLLRQDISI